jgi:hypothetical protein
VPDELPLVTFEVLLRTAGSGRQPHLGNLGDFQPKPDAIERCRRWMVLHGVNCRPANFSLACSAPGQVFASLFSVNISRNPNSGPGQPSVLVYGDIRVPAEIADIVDQVNLPAAPEFFP